MLIETLKERHDMDILDSAPHRVVTDAQVFLIKVGVYHHCGKS